MAKKISRESAPQVIDQNEIARCAYFIWESEGRPEGRAAQHWFEAEAMLRSNDQPGDENVRSARRPKSAQEPAPAATPEFQTIN